MVDNHLLQKSITQYLKVKLPIYATGISLQVKENQFQGSDFTYPAIRVDINSQVPIGDGTDHLKLSTSLFTVGCFSEYPSSFEANYMAGKVMRTLFNKQIYGTKEDLTTPDHYLPRIDCLYTSNANRISDRLWLAQVFFSALVHDYNGQPGNS